jgi:hypothetical protein
MPDTMIGLRRIEVSGPRYGMGISVWSAQLDLGAPFHATGQPAVVRNHSIRLLMQESEPSKTDVFINPSKKINFLRPNLLVAAATTRNLRGLSAAERPNVRLFDFKFAPVEIVRTDGTPSPDQSPYSELVVVPGEPWAASGFKPDENGDVQVAAPPLRARGGVLRVGMARNDEIAAGAAQSVKNPLGLDWSGSGSVGIFGSMGIASMNAAPPIGQPAAVSPAICFDLVPEGIEFDLKVPNPFEVGSVIEWLDLRVRLVALRGTQMTQMRLDLVGGAGIQRLRQDLDRMIQNLRLGGGAIGLQVDSSGVPPLSWELKRPKASGPFTCGDKGSIPAMLLRQEGVTIRILTRPDPAGGEPGVADLVGHTTVITGRLPNAPLLLQVNDPPLQTGTTVKVEWPATKSTEAGPMTVTVPKLAGVADVTDLQSRLTELWSASGALSDGDIAPYGFVALQRGWLQMPLDDLSPLAAQSTGVAGTASVADPGQPTFRGLFRLDSEVSPAGSINAPALTVTAAERVNVVVQWPGGLSSDGRTITLTIGNASGAIDGALWAGEASPTPTEILPSLDSGPASLTGIPISFGRLPASGWPLTMETTRFEPGNPVFGTIHLALPPSAMRAHPVLRWSAHANLALVASAAMTRTAQSALRPSATRDLVPDEAVVTGGAGQIDLIFDGARLPTASASANAAFKSLGEGRWRWPWPMITGTVSDYPASPAESAGVALAALTLPGIEFTVATPDEALKNLKVSLRYDLPILDELFANAKAPDSEGPSPKNTLVTALPTALDLKRLSEAWRDNADRLARARTEADRVVIQAGAALWHSMAGVTAGTVPGLVEPYGWSVGFEFANATAANPDIALGAYKLGSDWYSGGPTTPDGESEHPSALAGFAGSFLIQQDLGTLKPDPAGPIQIDGFAASSFMVDGPGVTAKKQLHDSRGLSLAVDPDVSLAGMVGRSVVLRDGDGEHKVHEIVRVLGTARAPVKLSWGAEASPGASFWYRDLPLAATSGGTLVFDPAGGLETGTAVNALAPDRLPLALYEWRFWSEAQPNSFVIPLAGPLVLRPLRLAACTVDAAGNVSTLEIIASLSLAALKDGDEDPDPSPFIDADDYATGNLIRLKWTGPGGNLRLDAIQRVVATNDPKTPFDNVSTPVSFRDLAIVTTGGDAGSAVDAPGTDVELSFNLAVDGGVVVATNPNLRVTLFGQDCLLTAVTATISSHSLSVTYAPPSGTPAGSMSGVTRLDLTWSVEERPQIALMGTLAVPAPAPAGAGVAPADVITRVFGASPQDTAGKPPALKWIGLRLPDGFIESIDHENGTLQITLPSRAVTEGDALFSGFELPAGVLRGYVGLVFAPQLTTLAWPKLDVVTGFIEFAFDASAKFPKRRIASIRHRHRVEQADTPGSTVVRSRFLIDAAFEPVKSTIEWPLGLFKQIPMRDAFDPDPNTLADWSVDMVATGTAAVLEHRVRPLLMAHELQLELLWKDGADVKLSPWRFRAAVEHRLTLAKSQLLTWTSIDEVVLIDGADLTATATEPYAFMARYKESDPYKDKMLVAGVMPRSLAEAGFPTGQMLKAIADSRPRDPGARRRGSAAGNA